MSEEYVEDFLQKVESGLAEAQHNMLVEKALRGKSLMISDGNGDVLEVSAKELLHEQQEND